MSRLTWNNVGTRYYETGVDQGVLYVGDNAGVAWPGLVSVEESSSGGDAQPFYIDGFKYLNLSAREEFTATIEAISSPREFDVCDGIGVMAFGLFATQQRRKPFGFSYRTLIGSDTIEAGTEYKLHLIYNALADPAGKTHTSISDQPELGSRSWSITTMGITFPGMAPIAHLVVDTRYIQAVDSFSKEDIIYNIERHIYGDLVYDAMLPDPGQMIQILQGVELQRDPSPSP